MRGGVDSEVPLLYRLVPKLGKGQAPEFTEIGTKKMVDSLRQPTPHSPAKSPAHNAAEAYAPTDSQAALRSIRRNNPRSTRPGPIS